MSKIMVESRICDQCERAYDESIPAWMTLTFPNVVTEDDSPEFDFCTYECLEGWVNEDDAENEPVPNPVLAQAAERAKTAVVTEPEEAPFAGPPIAPRPAMTLAQALAMGLSPDVPV